MATKDTPQEEKWARFENLLDCAKRLRNSVVICDRSRGTFRRHIYHNCFVAKNAVSNLIALGAANDRSTAETVATLMIKAGLVHACSSSDRNTFKDGDHLYRFECDKQVEADAEKAGTPFGPFYHDPLLFRFPAHVKTNSLFITYKEAEKLEWALSKGNGSDIADTLKNVRKRMLKTGSFENKRPRVIEDARFENCVWQKIAKNSKMSTTWQLKGVEDRDFVVTRISGELAVSPEKAIEMLTQEAGRKKYEPQIQKITTIDPLQYVRRRVQAMEKKKMSSSSIDGGLSDPPVREIGRLSVSLSSEKETSSMTNQGQTLLDYCRKLVSEQLAKGDTVRYNKIKSAIIRKFTRETYDVYKDEVRAICRNTTYKKEEELIRRHRSFAASEDSTSSLSTPPRGSEDAAAADSRPREHDATPPKTSPVLRHPSSTMNLMSRSISADEMISNLIIKYANVHFTSRRWSMRDMVVLRDNFVASDGRCVLWEMSVEHKKVPHRDGFMRITVHGNVYVAEPIPGEPKKCRLTRTTQVTYSGSNATVSNIGDAQSLFDSMMEAHRTSSSARQTELIDFEVMSVLGKGGYGKVYQVRHKATGEIYAMKSISKQHTIKKRQVDGVMAERQILLRVKHPYIVHMAWAFQTRSSLYFVMEFVRGGDLLSLITKIKSGLPYDLCRIYAAEIALALNHLHKQKIVYRDMKPENILIGADGHAKIADFGVSYIQDSARVDEGPKTFVGTEVYMAPEIINEAIRLQRASGKQVRKARSSYGCRIDWWSFGIVFYEILTARHPFLSRDRLKTIRRIIQYYKPNVSKISKVAGQLALGLLRREPDKRYGFSQIKAHAYFDGFDWKAVESNTMRIPDACMPEKIVADAEERRRRRKMEKGEKVDVVADKTKAKEDDEGGVVEQHLTKDLVEESVGERENSQSFFEHEDLFDGFEYSPG